MYYTTYICIIATYIYSMYCTWHIPRYCIQDLPSFWVAGAGMAQEQGFALLASLVILTPHSHLCAQICGSSEVTGHSALVGAHEDLSLSFGGGEAKIKGLPVCDLVTDPL